MNTMKREMKQISPELMKVACDLECLIGTNCVNHKYDRENYRYPVHIPNPHDEWKPDKYQYNLNNYLEVRRGRWTYEEFSRTFYKFGSNEIRVGKAVLEILNYLEKHFGIDFEELERER